MHIMHEKNIEARNAASLRVNNTGDRDQWQSGEVLTSTL